MKFGEEGNLIQWTDKLSIGIPVIDGEHKTLVELCNNLYKLAILGNAVSTNQVKDGMREALKKCADYAKYHFTHEEELMQYCNFDEVKFKQHQDEHIDFKRKVLSEIENFDSETRTDVFNFVKYLYDWILSHIAHCDRLYVDDLMAYLKDHPSSTK